MATRTMPFCLEMLTFGYPESSGALACVLDAGRAYGHSHNAFLLGNAYIWPPRELLGTLWNTRAGPVDAGRAYAHSFCTFHFKATCT